MHVVAALSVLGRANVFERFNTAVFLRAGGEDFLALAKGVSVSRFWIATFESSRCCSETRSILVSAMVTSLRLESARWRRAQRFEALDHRPLQSQ